MPTQRKKGGRASKQGEQILGEGSGAGEVSSNVLPSGDHSNESPFENVSSQTNEKGEACVHFEQELHLSQELPSSSNSKIPPDKVVKKHRPQVTSCELPLLSSGGPGAAAQLQIPPALLCTEAAGQPKTKPHQHTAAILEVPQDLPSTIHDDTANQLWLSFNVKPPPPGAQAVHVAEISGVLPEAEWINEPAANSSASVNPLAVTLREGLEFSVTTNPAIQLSDKKPPSEESSHIQAVHEEINEDITSSKPILDTNSPSPESLVGAPASSTFDPEALPAVSQPAAAFDNHSLLKFLGGESVDEFSPLLFNSSAGDDGFLSPQVTKTSILPHLAHACSRLPLSVI